MDWETIYRELKVGNWVILLVLSSFSYFFLSPAQTLGTIAGGVIVIANFKVFQHTIRKAFSSGSGLKAGKVSILLKYYLRLFALGVILLVFLWKEWADPVGLAIGFSTVVVSIVFLGIGLALGRSSGGAS